ncbi:MAG: hypothetical protein U0003_00200 [Vampirovibrionales bacterium]
MTHHSPSWSEQLESWSHCLALAYRSHWSLASRWADGRIYCEPSQMAHQHLRDVMPSSLLSTPITPSLNQLEQRLLQQYALSAFKQQCSTIRYSDTLAYLCYLEALTSPNPHEFWQAFSHFSPLSCLRWWDVGCKNWSYLQAFGCFAFAIHSSKRTTVLSATGIELIIGGCIGMVTPAEPMGVLMRPVAKHRDLKSPLLQATHLLRATSALPSH